MNLSDFPRPPQDNGCGIHLDTNLSPKSRMGQLGSCKDLGLTWALICSAHTDLVIDCAEEFWREGIMPVLRPYVKVDDLFGWADYTKKCADRLQMRPYIQIYNEPDNAREWLRAPRWREYNRTGAIFPWKWASVAQIVANNGGLPGLQVLSEPELDAVIEATEDLGNTEIWERAWFCPHPYGNYGPHIWKPAEIGEDSQGVMSFVKFAVRFHHFAGFVPPFICGEGAWERGPVPIELHAKWHKELFGWFKTGMLSNGEPLPDYLFAFCPWILAGGDWRAWWSRTSGIAWPTIDAVKSLMPFVRSAGGVQGTPNIPEPPNIPDTGKDWRVVSPWMAEDEALEDIATFAMIGFPDYGMEERK